MNMLLCPRCGELLEKENDLFQCRCCGAIMSEEDAEKSAKTLRSLLDEAKIELLANRRRLLWSATHEKYPSKERVMEAAHGVLSLSDNDFLPLVYLHSHDRDPHVLVELLGSSDVTSTEAEEVFRWLLPSLCPRLIGPLHDFLDRHFKGEERLTKINALEEEAAKVASGLYEPSFVREAFLCYSSKDMPKVIETMDELERNGFACFAAFRNLRHGKGAQENYLSAIKTAMRSCEVIVFLSSRSSRSVDCDAVKVELPFLNAELPGKPRVEFLLEEETENVPYLVKKTLRNTFGDQPRYSSIEELIDFISEELANKDKKAEDAAALEKALEEEQRKHKEELKRIQMEAEMQRVREEAERQAREKVFEEERKRKFLAEEERKRRAVEDRRRIAIERASLRLQGRTILYGSYPQTEAEPAIAITLEDKAKHDYGYVEFGGKQYAEYNGKFFLVEPIRWLVLDAKDGKAFCISERLLDAGRIDPSSSRYETTEIRRFLKGDFVERAFPDGGTALEPLDGDKVSLPSKKDITNPSYGFDDDEKGRDYLRKAKITDYGKAKGGDPEPDGYCGYWAKSNPDTPQEKGIGVIWHGGLGIDSVSSPDNGIRVVASIRLSNEDFAVLEKSLEQHRKEVSDASLKTQGDYLLYGLYPQRGASASLFATLDKKAADKRGYVFHEGRLYAKKADKYFEVEPIRWRILWQDGVEAYAISEWILAEHRYDWNSREYKPSEIRAWLNEEFFLSAFPDGGTDLLLIDGDKVSLPSKADLTNPAYRLDSTSARAAKATPYACADRVWNSNGFAVYWIKASPSSNANEPLSVWNNGGFYGSSPFSMDTGVRPVIRVRLKRGDPLRDSPEKSN